MRWIDDDWEIDVTDRLAHPRPSPARGTTAKLYAALAAPAAPREAAAAARVPLPPADRRPRAAAGFLYRALAAGGSPAPTPTGDAS